jgi:hemerythrin
MSFTWSEDLSTGIRNIDAQHIALIGQFNDLIEACSQKKGHEEVARFLTFLTGYVNRHFDDEERAMARNLYDGIEAHIKEHEQYRVQLARLKDDVLKRGMTDQLVSEAVWVAANWFISHIKRTDQAMAAALRGKGR